MKNINAGSYDFDAFNTQENELKILQRQAELALPLEQKIWQEAGLAPGMKVLDMGCGSGITSGFMADYVCNGSVLGIDPSEKLIAQAELFKHENKTANLDFCVGDIYSNDLPENEFDFIYCRLLFQHLREPQKALSSLKKLLKPNGIICVVDIDDSWLMLHPEPEAMKKLVCRSAKAQEDDGGDRYTGRKLPQYLHLIGFKEIDSRINVISSFDIGLESFLKIAFDFRTERLPIEELAQAQLELNEIYSLANTPSAWGALGFFVATGKK
jgi:ubiquinone/menaquinone biosynthesis C-methylase UbiE